MKMEFVDFDEAAARRAIEACTSAAADLDHGAERLVQASQGQLGVWSGQSRIGFDANADDIARVLRIEAGNLEDTADAIRRALADALEEDDERRQDRQEQLEEVEEQRRLELESVGAPG